MNGGLKSYTISWLDQNLSNCHLKQLSHGASYRVYLIFLALLKFRTTLVIISSGLAFYPG